MSKHSVKTYYESGRAEVRPADTTEELLDIMTECYSLQGEELLGDRLTGWEVIKNGQRIITRGLIPEGAII